MDSRKAGEQLVAIADDYVRTKDMEFQDALELAMLKHPALTALYIDEKPTVVSNRKPAENASFEVDKRALAFAQANNCGYEEAVEQVLDEFPSLKADYLGE